MDIYAKMKKKKSIIGKKIVFILPIEPYSQELIVVCNGQFSDVVKVLKKLGTVAAKESLKYIEENKDKYLEREKHYEATLYTSLPNGYVMLIDHNMNSWIDTVGAVVHESLHLTHYILQRAGLTLTQESEEAFTYLTEKTTENILEKIYPPK
jgi:hypothetical protein